MKKLAICVAACALLTGCMLDKDTRMVTHRNSCAGYGFTPGTPQFAQCMQMEENSWQARFDGAMNQIQQNNYQQQQLNLQRQQLYQQQMQNMQNNSFRANCTSNRYGTTTYTNCY